ncbi:sensor histidine kinase [Devosia sediminis]|uniref:histidine kinase n=1 Tax=Devosia sediminis TaxID=2798801 RepID=A0A934IYQ8_9HYPH|nr:HAMP domain-containing sensor histidine kinase [Devosia sediminis]MBJ3785545.1 HAMP domain-containing histidine kinase [Devosia sediminis]
MLGLAAVWVVGSLAAAAFVLQYLFMTNLERDVAKDLEAAMTRVIALIDLNAAVPALAGPLPDPRYETPLGGRYWQIEATDGSGALRSRSLWDMVIPAQGQGDGLRHFSGPDGWHLVYVTRSIDVGGRTLQVSVGEDHDPIHAAGTAFLWDVVWLFSLLGALILAAAWLQLRLGLVPLTRLREEIDRIRQGAQTRLDVAFPSELLPLVDEVNALLGEREANIERARERASDLAHGLKTPLAALHGIAIRVREKGNAADADLIDDMAFEMSRRVDYQMRLSTIRLRSHGHRESASLNSAILRTIAVLKKTGRGEELHWLAQLEEEITVDIHRQDLMELVGVLLENAAHWASSRVIVRCVTSNAKAMLAILDDGPGIPEDQLSLLGERGQRLDQSKPGTGLGLAIAREIVALNGGKIQLSKSDIGGLAVTITFRLAQPELPAP